MYDYRKEMVEDIKNYIQDDSETFEAYKDDPDKLFDYYYDDLWTEDCITGNGCYGYADEEICLKYVGENLPLYFDAAYEFDVFSIKAPLDWVKKNPGRHMDCTIRCYLLSECLEKALKELGV